MIGHGVQQRDGDGSSAYEKRFEQGPFPGIMVPFGVFVLFKQDRGTEKAKATPKFSNRMVPGVFMGYEQDPGGKWSGLYTVAALLDFVNMDFRVGHHVHVRTSP